MTERTWKLETKQNPDGGKPLYALVGYESTGPREMKAAKVLEDLSTADLPALLSVLHEHLHGDEHG